MDVSRPVKFMKYVNSLEGNNSWLPSDDTRRISGAPLNITLYILGDDYLIKDTAVRKWRKFSDACHGHFACVCPAGVFVRVFNCVTNGSFFGWLERACALSSPSNPPKNPLQAFRHSISLAWQFLCPTPFIDVPTRHLASVTTGNKTTLIECIFAL